MSNLTKIFEKREETFDKFTEKLLQELQNVTEAANRMIGDNLEQRMKWQTVNWIGNTITIAGAIKFEVGEIILNQNNEEITITEELQNSFNQVIRIGVPFELAEKGTSDEVYAYLKEIERKSHEAMIVHESENIAHDTAADLVGEFRVQGLTKDQINSMIVLAEQSKGKVN